MAELHPCSVSTWSSTCNIQPERRERLSDRLEEMESKITDKTKMIVVVNPSNPTGGVFSRETLEKLSEIAIRHDLLVIADEIYSQLVYDGTEHVSIASLPGMKERTILINGFSKGLCHDRLETGLCLRAEGDHRADDQDPSVCHHVRAHQQPVCGLWKPFATEMGI